MTRKRSSNVPGPKEQKSASIISGHPPTPNHTTTTTISQKKTTDSNPSQVTDRGINARLYLTTCITHHHLLSITTLTAPHRTRPQHSCQFSTRNRTALHPCTTQKKKKKKHTCVLSSSQFLPRAVYHIVSLPLHFRHIYVFIQNTAPHPSTTRPVSNWLLRRTSLLSPPADEARVRCCRSR